MRHVPWQRCQAWDFTHHLPYLQWAWPGKNAAGIFLDSANLPQMPWQRQVYFQSLPYLWGTGRVKHHKTLSVKIPAGVDEGDRIRLSGEGEAGVNNGPPGDLYVVIQLAPHQSFSGITMTCTVKCPSVLLPPRWVGKSRYLPLKVMPKSEFPLKPKAGKFFDCAARESKAYGVPLQAISYATW